MNLTFDDIGEFIFNILKINPDDYLAFDFNTGQYDTRQTKFKPGTNTDSFVTAQPINFKDHLISATKQLANVTKVTFKNIPLSVPNKEIIHLCKVYGNPIDSKVT